MKNPMLKFIMKGKKEDMVHTSVYARAQNSGGIGVTSTRSFADRMKLRGNRQRIREYNDSRVVTQAYASSGMKAKVYEAPAQDVDTSLDKSKQGGSVNSAKMTNSTNRLSNTTGPARIPGPSSMRKPGISKKI